MVDGGEWLKNTNEPLSNVIIHVEDLPHTSMVNDLDEQSPEEFFEKDDTLTTDIDLTVKKSNISYDSAFQQKILHAFEKDDALIIPELQFENLEPIEYNPDDDALVGDNLQEESQATVDIIDDSHKIVSEITVGRDLMSVEPDGNGTENDVNQNLPISKISSANKNASYVNRRTITIDIKNSSPDKNGVSDKPNSRHGMLTRRKKLNGEHSYCRDTNGAVPIAVIAADKQSNVTQICINNTNKDDELSRYEKRTRTDSTTSEFSDIDDENRSMENPLACFNHQEIVITKALKDIGIANDKLKRER